MPRISYIENRWWTAVGVSTAIPLVLFRGGTAVETPSLLWVDLTVSGQPVRPPRVFRDRCTIRPVAHELLSDDPTSRGPVDSICLDYDYPDRTIRLWTRPKLVFVFNLDVPGNPPHQDEFSDWQSPSHVRTDTFGDDLPGPFGARIRYRIDRSGT